MSMSISKTPTRCIPYLSISIVFDPTVLQEYKYLSATTLPNFYGCLECHCYCHYYCPLSLPIVIVIAIARDKKVECYVRVNE